MDNGSSYLVLFKVFKHYDLKMSNFLNYLLHQTIKRIFRIQVNYVITSQSFKKKTLKNIEKLIYVSTLPSFPVEEEISSFSQKKFIAENQKLKRLFKNKVTHTSGILFDGLSRQRRYKPQSKWTWHVALRRRWLSQNPSTHSSSGRGDTTQTSPAQCDS